MPDRFGEIPILPPQSSSPKKRAKKRPPTPAAKAINSKEPSRSRAWAWTIGAVLLFTLYSCLGFLGVPYYLSEILPKQFNKETGMVLESSGITFNPLTFRLKTEKVQILSDTATPIISLNSFMTDLAPLSLLRRDLVSNTLTINELNLNLTRELDGSYNVQKFLGDKKASNVSKIMDFSDLPFFFSLNNITIRNSRIIFNDSPAGKTHTIENIQLALPTFSNIPFQADQYLRPRFSAVIDGSPVELTGQAHMGDSGINDQATNLSCDIHSLNLPLYSEYLPFSLPFEFTKGKANGTIQLNFNPEEKNENKLSISFKLQVSGAELQSETQTVVLTVPAARVSGKLQPISRLLVLDSIALREPTLSSYGESFSKNMINLLQDKEHSTTPGVPEQLPFHLITDLLIVDDGIVRLFKNQQEKTPATVWKSLQLSVKKYTTRINKNRGQNNGSFRVSGEKEGSSSFFSWQGTIPTPESLTGPLALVKVNSSDLLEAAGEADSFQLHGIADLKGQLSLRVTKDIPPTTVFHLKESEISIEDFTLTSEETTVLEAPIVKIQGLSFEKGSLDFGNVYLRNSSAHFPYDNIPEPFKLFSTARYRIRGIEFDGNAIFAAPSKGGQKLVFSKLTVKANELDISDTTKTNLSLSAETTSGGILKAQGQIKLAPFSLSVTTGFRGLPTKAILPFFSKSSILRDIGGELDGKGSLTLPKKNFTGELQSTNGAIETSEDLIFSWERSTFQNVNFTAEPFHLGVAQADINHADFSWQITDKGGEPLQQLSSFLQKSFTKKEQPGKKQATFLPVNIKKVIFNDTKIRIQDHRLTPKWEAEVVDFTGTVQNIHSVGSGSTSAVTFNGELDESPFAGQGEVDLFSEEENGTVRITLEKYPLASFHEQLSPWLDINTSVGEFDLTLENTWQDKKYHSSGFLLLSDIEPVSETALSALPLALLSGPDNTYRMNFDFSRPAPIGKTVFLEELLALFQTLIVKGSVSPLLLATGDFTDLIGNEFTEFRPGELMLSDNGRKILTRFTALLIAHPYVGLELTGTIDEVLDEQAMREQLETVELKRVEKENKKLFDKWQAEKASYETKLHEQLIKAGPNSNPAELDIPDDVIGEFTPLQPEPVVIEESMLLELAQKRANVLAQHFTTQLALQPERITINQSNILKGEIDGLTNGVIITLKVINRN